MFIIKALRECAIPLSFQYYPSTARKPSFPHGFDAGILPIFRWSNGVIEVPVGVYQTIRVKMDATVLGKPRQETMWYAPESEWSRRR